MGRFEHAKLYQHLQAKNDTNGNPRRLYAIYTAIGERLAVFDEGYKGRPKVIAQLCLDQLPSVYIEPSEYRDWLKMGELLNFNHLEETVRAKLPSGSGFDNGWELYPQDNNKVRYESAYHTMNQDGYYDGWAEFYITLDLNDPGDFKLKFRGKDSQYLNQKYMLREFMEDTIYHALTYEEPVTNAVDKIAQTLAQNGRSPSASQ